MPCSHCCCEQGQALGVASMCSCGDLYRFPGRLGYRRGVWAGLVDPYKACTMAQLMCKQQLVLLWLLIGLGELVNNMRHPTCPMILAGACCAVVPLCTMLRARGIWRVQPKFGSGGDFVPCRNQLLVVWMSDAGCFAITTPACGTCGLGMGYRA